MIYGMILFVAASVATASALPPCVCTRNYQPVCGSDGHTYDNACMLECAKTTNGDLSMAKTGRCPDDQGICVCTLEFRPVCGSDGKTYPNKCSLNCQRSVRLVGDGPCPQAESLKLETPPCICTREARPVCGSDGVTYPNPCMLNCAIVTNPQLTLKSNGPCVDEVKVVEQPDNQNMCICTRQLKPVCGSDGVTYSNPCLLNCATATNPKLSLKSYGPCIDEVKSLDQPDGLNTCACTRNLQPVCGSDGVTYSNPCLLNCASATNPKLSLKSYGPCIDEVKSLDQPDGLNICACTRNLQPVCGSDGITYPNPCLLNCATATNPKLSLKSYGPCIDEVKSLDQPDGLNICACTRNLQPVCGSDGITYRNPCLLNCATANNPKLTLKSYGPCDDKVKGLDQPDSHNSCVCTRNMRPVCGSDGKTYNNPCLLNCATKNNPSLTVARQGFCEGVNVVESAPRHAGRCNCDRELAPVCGSDGETYSTACIMRCRNPNAELVHEGPCEV